MKEYKNPEDLTAKTDTKELTKRLVEKAMETELTHHLGYDKNILPATTPAILAEQISANHKG